MKLQLIKKLVALLCFAAVWGVLVLPSMARAGPINGEGRLIVTARVTSPTNPAQAMIDTLSHLLQEGQSFTWTEKAYYDLATCGNSDDCPPIWVVLYPVPSGNVPFPPGASFVPADSAEGCVGMGDTLTMVMNWTPTYCDSGLYEIKWWMEYYPFSAPCNKVGTSLTLFEIHKFQVDNVNRSPSIDSVIPSSQTKQVGRNVHIDIFARDLDREECGEDSIMYWYTPNPTPLINAVLSPNGSFDWMPQPSEVGTHNLRFWVTDQSNDSSASPHSIVNVYVCGDLDLNGILTGSDVVLELLAVFLGQDPPAPFPASDLNGDGQRTATDVVLELNLTFLGIPADCAP